MSSFTLAKKRKGRRNGLWPVGWPIHFDIIRYTPPENILDDTSHASRFGAVLVGFRAVSIFRINFFTRSSSCKSLKGVQLRHYCVTWSADPTVIILPRVILSALGPKYEKNLFRKVSGAGELLISIFVWEFIRNFFEFYLTNRESSFLYIRVSG